MINEIEEFERRYDEAQKYLSGDLKYLNPQKAFSIYKELSSEGFVGASICYGMMLCMGLGTEKDSKKGKEILKSQEAYLVVYLGCETEVFLERFGLFNELTFEEKLKCIDFMKGNGHMTYALYLQRQIEKA